MPETRRRVLRVTVAGGGPVGLMFALTLKSLMPDEVTIQIFDDRWASTSNGVTWRGKNEGRASSMRPHCRAVFRNTPKLQMHRRASSWAAGLVQSCCVDCDRRFHR